MMNTLLNIYPHGSRVYGTATKKSDYDYIIVIDDAEFTTDHIINGKKEYVVYSKSQWEELAKTNHIDFCECFFLPETAKIKETYIPEFKIEKEKIRSRFSREASNSWVKCKKKLTVEKDFAPRIAKKSLWHSLRLLNFGIQILEYGKIVDYTAMNYLYAEIVNNPCNEWQYYHEKYHKLYNQMKSKFRQYDHIQNKNIV